MPEVKDYNAAVARVRALQSKRASATDTDQKGNPKGHMPSETDPADKGTVSVPKVTDGETNLPSSRPELTDSITPGAATVPGGELNGVGPTGTEVPTTVDGKSKETAATSPTTPLSKIAASAQAAADRIKALRNKQANTSLPAAPVATPAPATKVAADASLEPNLDTAMLCKLANTLLSTEEGVKMVEGQLVKAAGLEAARGILVAAQQQNEEYIKAANAQDDWQKSAAAQELAELQYAENLLKSASAAELAEIEKIATVHQHTMVKIAHPYERACYQQGAMDAAYMLDSIAGHTKKAGMPGMPPDGGAGGPPPGADPMGGAGGPPPGAPGEGPGAPEIPGGGPMDGGPQDIQQIAQILMQAVQSGEIDEAGAEQIMQILSQGQGGEGGAPAGGDAGAPPDAAPPEAGAGGPPPDAAPGGDDMPPDVKAASALFAKLVPSK